MIPKIIHQFWIGPRTRPDALIDTWRKHNPSWEHVLWTEANIPNDFLLQSKIDEMPHLAGKVDMMRYETLLRYGGFCIDADAECVKPLDDFFTENDCFTCWESEEARPGLIAVGYMAAVPDCQFFKSVVEDIRYKNYDPREEAWLNVGNQHFTDTYQKYNYDKLTIYPSHYFIPDHFTGTKYSGTGDVYAKQHWGSTHKSNLYGK